MYVEQLALPITELLSKQYIVKLQLQAKMSAFFRFETAQCISSLPQSHTSEFDLHTFVPTYQPLWGGF